jgi:ParB-like chromosome segregation protein Spo0J
MPKLANLARTAGFNAGAEAYAKWADPRGIKVNEEIAALFICERETVEKIRDSMIRNGFDKAEPLVIWKGAGCVVDGYTRLQAALEAGVEEVLVEEKEFAGIEEAKAYTLTRQLNRRNLSGSALLGIAALLETIKDGGKTNSEVAKDLGVSRTTLYRAREVSGKASEQVKEQVRQGDISINHAYNKLTEKAAKPAKPAGVEEADYPPPKEEGSVERGAGAATVKAPAAGSKSGGISIPLKDMLGSIAALLETFLEANKGGEFEKLEKAENIRLVYETVRQLSMKIEER